MKPMCRGYYGQVHPGMREVRQLLSQAQAVAARVLGNWHVQALLGWGLWARFEPGFAEVEVAACGTPRCGFQSYLRSSQGTGGILWQGDPALFPPI